MLSRPEIPPSHLKNFTKNFSILRPLFKLSHLSHIIFQLLPIPHIEPTPKIGVLLHLVAIPQTTSAHPTTFPTTHLLYPLQDPFHHRPLVLLTNHTLVTAKFAGFGVTLPIGALPFALYQFILYPHPTLPNKEHPGNHKLTLPPIPPPRHLGF